jgi:type VI secretion system VasD/TssJ family lipoprotein
MRVDLCRTKTTMGFVGLMSIGWACAHKTAQPEPCTEQERLPLVVDGASNLNEGPDGQPLPTVVRVYQLKGTGRLEAASLEQMIRSAPEILRDDALETQEFTLDPRGRHFPDMRRNPAATHLAVVGLVRRANGRSWWALATLPAPDPFHCHRPPNRSRWLQFYLQGYQVAYVP